MSQSGVYFNAAGGGNPVETITGNVGGAVGADSSDNINIVGTGSVTVTGNPGTNTLTISVADAGIVWNVITAAASPMLINNGYIANNAGTVTLTLPAAAVVGSIMWVTGINNATGWKIAQNAGQTIYFGIAQTTPGVTGYLASSATRDTVQLLCVVANTTWQVITSIGNITYN